MNISLLKPAKRVSRSLPIEYFILANLHFEGPVIGQLAGQPIRETAIDASGCRYRYAGVARRDPDGRFGVGTFRAGEWIVQPGLVYALEAADQMRLRA